LFVVNLNHFKFVLEKSFLASQMEVVLQRYAANYFPINFDWMVCLSDNKILDIQALGNTLEIQSNHAYSLKKKNGKVSLKGKVNVKSRIKLPVLFSEYHKPYFELIDVEWERTNLRYLKWISINPKLILKLQDKKIRNHLTSRIQRILEKKYISNFSKYINPILFGEVELKNKYFKKLHYSLVGLAFGGMSTVGEEIIVRAYGRALFNDLPFQDLEEHSRFDLKRIESNLSKRGSIRDAKLEFVFSKKILAHLLQIKLNEFIPDEFGLSIGNMVIMQMSPTARAALLLTGHQSGTLECTFVPTFNLDAQTFDIKDMDIAARLDSSFANFLLSNLGSKVNESVEDYFPIRIDALLGNLSHRIVEFFYQYPYLSIEMDNFLLSKAHFTEDSLTIEFSSEATFRIQ
jgi:hypothetical protein